MRFEFYKILDQEYVGDFIAGNLYMNTLNFFRRIEGNAAQGDPLEGICGSIRKDQLKQFGINFDEELTDAIMGNVSLISEYYGLNNLFCLYRLLIDDEKKIVEPPKQELCKFNDQGTTSKVVIRIKDTEEFLNRLVAAIEAGLQTHTIEYGICGAVSYSNAWISAEGPGTRSAFHKEPQYAYQNEWRLCLLRNALIDAAFSFSIGDLSDITEIISLEQFLEHPQALYPGYSVAEEKLDLYDDGFRIFGSINTVNHLMYSYMVPAENIPTRSDQAQADWHYTKYLQLTGQSEKVDAYLEAQMKKIRDLDHMELLVHYRLSVGEWVKSTDAFMFFINEEPTAIHQDPVRFFFPLHTILMQHKEAADAGKLWKIATGDYQMPDDVKQTMQSDVLFALGFYDQVVPLFLKMKETSTDPVLDFYLAVAYLHLLDFERAHRYLATYERYFSHSPEKAQKTAHLRRLVDCYRNNTQLEIERQAHPLEKVAWDEKLDILLGNTQKGSAFLGVDTLYKIERAQKWDILDRFKVITVCPLTIVEIMEWYLKTGDPVFFRVIMRLERLPQLEIKSPELDYYLAMDFSNRDAPSVTKMEQALRLQEIQKEKQITHTCGEIQ